jgi:hypothetical protein
MLAVPPTETVLEARIESALDREPNRPRCVHSLYEELIGPSPDTQREGLLDLTRRAAEDLVDHGRARRRFVSAIAIGAHCEDAVYWSARSPHRELEEFGPEFETLAIARRLASCIRCSGL